jgi:methyl-accepting chemotaxis protein
VEDQLSSMNDLSTSAEKLSHMANDLKLLVGKFKV